MFRVIAFIAVLGCGVAVQAGATQKSGPAAQKATQKAAQKATQKATQKGDTTARRRLFGRRRSRGRT